MTAQVIRLTKLYGRERGFLERSRWTHHRLLVPATVAVAGALVAFEWPELATPSLRQMTKGGHVMTEVLTPPRNRNDSVRRKRPAPLRVLVVVDEACTSPELCESIRAYADEHLGGSVEAHVIAPAHSRANQWYVDQDAARADAMKRLRACVSCLSGQGARTSGRLADPDPVQAIADALPAFAADEILLITASHHRSSWLHPNVIDRARRRFGEPIKHVVMPDRPIRRGA